jgi:hypothetical protein
MYIYGEQVSIFFNGGFDAYDVVLCIGWRVFGSDCFTGNLCPYDLHPQNEQGYRALREN